MLLLQTNINMISIIIFSKNNDITGCLCLGKCKDCIQDQESRTILGSKLTAINETTGNNVRK